MKTLFQTWTQYSVYTENTTLRLVFDVKDPAFVVLITPLE